MYEPSIGYRQLQWLHDTLLEAEANNEKVHILAHIPSGGGGCFRVWSREYRRIIDRFWNTVTGVFNGHTHNDEFNIFYSRTQPSYAINVGFNGGSATTYSHKNHNYKVYYVNSDSYVSIKQYFTKNKITRISNKFLIFSKLLIMTTTSSI